MEPYNEQKCCDHFFGYFNNPELFIEFRISNYKVRFKELVYKYNPAKMKKHGSTVKCTNVQMLIREFRVYFRFFKFCPGCGYKFDTDKMYDELYGLGSG